MDTAQQDPKNYRTAMFSEWKVEYFATAVKTAGRWSCYLRLIQASRIPHLMMCATLPPSMKGITIQSSLPATKDASSGSTLGWLYRRIVVASRMKSLRLASRRSKLQRLMAHTSPDALTRARYT